MVQPGETVTHAVGAVFLARGEYGFRAVVEDADAEEGGETRTRFSPVLHVKVE
jgi:hypothetical protein